MLPSEPWRGSFEPGNQSRPSGEKWAKRGQMKQNKQHALENGIKSALQEWKLWLKYGGIVSVARGDQTPGNEWRLGRQISVALKLTG